jgi:transcriptional regulator with XRE-family HTH domain
MSIGKQIRAGRALVGWSRKEMAEKSGVAAVTINQIEEEQADPRKGTLSDLVRSLEENGVELTDNYGVRIKPQGVEVLHGKDGLMKFFDDVYEHTRKNGGTIMQLGMDETFFTNILGDYSHNQKKRMGELVKERKDIKVLSIICEGDMNFFASDYNEYRWFPKEQFEMAPFYLYGDRIGIMTFQTIPAPTIVVLKFPAITLGYRKQFEVLWKMSAIPDLNKAAEMKAVVEAEEKPSKSRKK